MSFTLKVRQRSYEHGENGPDEITGETTAFIEARRVLIQCDVKGQRAREGLHSSWDQVRCPLTDLMSTTRLLSADDEDALLDNPGNLSQELLFAHPAKLIEVHRPDGEIEWVVASEAWLLGPGGQTIERIAP